MKIPVSGIICSLLVFAILAALNSPALSRSAHHAQKPGSSRTTSIKPPALRFRSGTDWQARVDSVERWAHHFCDSVVRELRNQKEVLTALDPELDEIQSSLSVPSSLLQAHGSALDSLSLEIEGSQSVDSLVGTVHGRIIVPDGTLKLYSVPGQKYFLRVIPQAPGPALHGKRVSKHIWLIETDSDSEVIDPGLE